MSFSVNLEATITVVIVLVITYALFGWILSYTWNNSINVITGGRDIGIWNALMLVVTIHILFGGFTSTLNSAMTTFRK
jgi:hypothetical protein